MNFPTGISAANNFSLGTQLQQNVPNPFTSQTVITFNSAVKQSLSMEIFDLMGQKVARLFENKSFENGAHHLTFDNALHRLSPGSYFLKLGSSSYSETRKMMVVE